MNLRQAYETLGIDSKTSPEDTKKKYRDLSKKHHPDIDQTEGSNERFKKINQAYDLISNKSNKLKYGEQSNFNPFGGFNHVQEIRMPEHINLETTVSFKESILGCKRELKYKRTIKCQECNGQGIKAVNNGCSKCAGRGQVVQQSQGMISVSTCPQCKGKVDHKSCDTCLEEGTVETDTSITVSIPAGVINDNILRLGSMGHYAGSLMSMMDQYMDAHLKIKVEPIQGLSLEGADVISKLHLSLLDAMLGCNKTVPTINGDKEITVPPSSRHKEEVILSNLGVAGKGSQRVILDVEYPTETKQLINTLQTLNTIKDQNVLPPMHE